MAFVPGALSSIESTLGASSFCGSSRKAWCARKSATVGGTAAVQTQKRGGAISMDLLSMFTRSKQFGPPVVLGDESLMAKKSHGTCIAPVQKDLRYGCDRETADKICCYNRHFAEYAGYFKKTSWLKDVPHDAPTEYYDSVTGKRLFTAPIGRSMEDFANESAVHGWPSFRDAEVDWENVRVLPNGECVSVDGTHLGHNLPDSKGNRYCINLVCVAGNPKQ
mmetsp:Transcript_15251/g.40938  ORF Transcript_15251/g.40938 Transcript_15251/m.40938 type:complete len:221 (+) Transcript_15251:52-714(+)